MQTTIHIFFLPCSDSAGDNADYIRPPQEEVCAVNADPIVGGENKQARSGVFTEVEGEK